MKFNTVVILRRKTLGLPTPKTFFNTNVAFSKPKIKNSKIAN